MMNEKVRNVIYTVVVAVVLVLLWYTKPLEAMSMGELAVRGVASLVMMYLCFFAKRPGRRMYEVAKKLVKVIADAAITAGDLLCDAVRKFLEWAAAVSLEDVGAVRDKIKESGQKELSRPIRVLCRWTDLTFAGACVALVTGAGLALHYQRPWIVVALNILGFVLFLLMINVAQYAEISKSSYRFCATEPAVGITCMFAQELILIAQLILAIAGVFLKGEIQTSVLYEPFLEVRLEGLQFGVSPIQLIILAGAMLALVGFVNVCSSMHALVESSEDEEMIED